MRLDKFLKSSRIIKRRTIAKDIVDLGFVKINGKISKPSTQIKEGDIVELTLGDKVITIKIISSIFSSKKEEARDNYEIISEIYKDKTI